VSEPLIDVATTEPGSAAWWAAHADRLARRRPRTGGLTIERIVEAAVEIIDAHGLEALTVRNLAARFETSSATLYRHVASVEELRVLVIDRVLGEVELPEPSLPAREKVVWLAVELRRVLVAHSEVVPALRAAPLLGPNAQRGAEAGYGCLLEMGFPEEIAVPAYLALIDFVLGSVFFDSATGGHGTTEGGRAAALSGDDVVRFGLDVFLTGLTSVIAPTGS
jgi:AcrR family transcriptional regulator